MKLEHRSGSPSVSNPAKTRAEFTYSMVLNRIKVIVLGLYVGLRKGEIDLLPWSAVRFDSGVIRIEATEYFAPKTEHSIGDVPVEPEILELLRGFRARTKSPFVLPAGRRKPTHATSHQYYRCEPVFDRVLVWLRKHGVRGQKPLHALRKEYGSLIHEKFDLVTAKELLRHSSVAITAAHYVENRKRGTIGLGALLAPDRNGVQQCLLKLGDSADAGRDDFTYCFPIWHGEFSPFVRRGG